MIEAVWAGLSGELGVMYQIITILATLSIPASIYFLIDGLRIRAQVLRMQKEKKNGRS